MRSILRRAQLALLTLPVLVAAACADTPTAPGIEAVDGGPAFVVAGLAPIAAAEGTPQAFFCGTSSDAEGDPMLCQWDFGNDGLYEAECTTVDGICRWDFNHDGTFEGQRSGSFDYSWGDNGIYPVRLHVTDASGSSDATTVATVENLPPYLVFYLDGIVSDVGQSVRYRTSFSDKGLGDAPWTYYFDFGDGTTIGPRAVNQPDAVGQYHAYAAPGLYTVTAIITDKDGGAITLVRTATVVENERPVADAGGPYIGVEGTAIEFSSAASIDDQATLTYVWDFGDGGRSVLANPSHRYLDNGEFTASVIVTDPTGVKDTAYATVSIANAIPDGAARAPEGGVREGVAYSLQIYLRDPGTADVATLQFQFDCGQGAGVTAWSHNNIVRCNGARDQGDLTTILRVRDKDGGYAEYIKTVPVLNVAPSATMTATSSTTIHVGESANFAATFSDQGAADGPFAWRVQWGDSPVATEGVSATTVTSAAPIVTSHTYTRTGTFNVFFFVTDKDGATRRTPVIAVTVLP